MRLLLAAAVLGLLVTPGATACSLAYQVFTQGDLDGDVVVTDVGQDGVRIDLASGQERTLSEDFFPLLAAHGGLIFHKGQEGLGADCTGREYFEVLDAQGDPVRSFEAVDDFDVDGDLLALVRNTTVTLVRIGTWQPIVTFPFDPGDPPTGQNAEYRFERPAIAVDAAGGHVAVSGYKGSIAVHDLEGAEVAFLAPFGGDRPLLDWHDRRLVVGVADGDATDFWIVTDLQTGAARTLRLAGPDDRWGPGSIAAGEMLLLGHADQVVHVDGQSSDRLRVPAGYAVGSLAADADGAVVLVRHADEHGEGAVAGIQRIGPGSIGTWYERNILGLWAPAQPPGFAWDTDGPSLTETGAPSTQPPADDQDTPTSFLLVLGALLLARRRV